MKIPMTERHVLAKRYAKEYRRTGKREKGKILNSFLEATGYHRTLRAGKEREEDSMR